MTSNELEYLSICAGVLLTLFPLREIIVNDSQIKWWKRVSSLGRYILAIAIVWTALSFYKIHIQSIEKSSEKTAEKQHLDSTIHNVKKELVNDVDNAFAKKGYKFDTITNTIIKINKAPELTSPVMDFIDDSTKLIGTLDKPILNIYSKVINDGIAYNPTASCLIFTYTKKDFKVIFRPITALNQVARAYAKLSMKYSLPVFLNKNWQIPIDTTYILIKETYTNKQIGGQMQPALRRIYFCYVANRPNRIEDIYMHNIDEINVIEVNRIINALKSHKYW